METCPWCEIGNCKALFQSDEIVKGIEDQLFLIDSKQLAKQTKYEELLKMKRVLKRNYFDFGK
ncbi:hypothetical protein ASG65_16390 [Bacillus sp. Leaf13]|nr:hypothetical protein ASG65_16390 [Bacillus sp. Leaf13]